MAILNRRLLLITGLAALLRLPTLAVESLWYDETFTAWLAGLPLDRLFAATLGDVHPPTWYLLEWAMVHSLGNSPFALRLISALAGIALVPAVWRLARAFNLSPEVQQSAALLTAVAPFAVYYSQEARAYSLIYLLTTVATIAVLERRWWLLILSATFALYLHNLTVFYIVALAWLAPLHHHQRPDWRILLSFATVGILWLPWVIWGLSGQVGDVQDGFWVRPPTAGTPFYILTAWLFSSKAGLLFLVSTPLLAIALVRGFNSSPARLDLAGLLLIPMGLAIIASALVAPILVERVIGSSAIALYLLIAPALVPGRWPRPDWPTVRYYALPAAFFLVLAAFYVAYWTTDRVGRYPWYYGLEEMLATANPETDGLFHANLATHIVLSYYLPDYEQVVWKQANDLSQSLTEETKWAMDMRQARFEDVACRHSRWWIAFYENPTTSDRERAEIARIVGQYHGRQVSTILKNRLVDARIYLLEEPCQLTAKRS